MNSEALYSIGIRDGHGSSCAIALNNKIIYSASEERYTKLKNDSGFPVLALQAGMKKFNIDPSQVDKLIFSQTDRREFSDYNYKREALLSVEDHFKLMDEYWKPRLSGLPYDKLLQYKLISKSKYFKSENFFDIGPEIFLEDMDNDFFVDKAKDAVFRHFKIPKERIHFADHHSCHALYATTTESSHVNNNYAIVVIDSLERTKSDSLEGRQ